MNLTFVSDCRAGIRRWAGSVPIPSLLALLLVATSSPALSQQTGSVSGQVTNASTAQPVAGAQIFIAGTPLGVLTNNEGRYLLVGVPAGEQTVSVEFIGFGRTSQEVQVAAGGTTELDFELYSRAIDLEGVVVTGTAGAARRREVGNSIAQVNAAEIANAPVADVVDFLQGRAAGASLLENSGQAGTGPTIRLRGNNSLTQGNNPLIYVDGIRVYGDPYLSAGGANQSSSALLDIDPADVERIEVIKGAAATTLYGTEASGGVIQIVTKSGAAGAPQWAATIEQGINNASHTGPDEDINPTGLGMNDCTDFPGCPDNGSWYRNGHIQTYRLSVRGGQEAMSYYVSGNWGNEQGIVAPQGSRDWGLRGNFDFRPTSNLHFRFNNSYASRGTTWIPDGNYLRGLTLNVMRFDRDYTPDHNDSVVLQQDSYTQTDHFTSGLGVTWNPSSSFTHRVNAGIDFAEGDNEFTQPFGFDMLPEGSREVRRFRHRTLSLDYVATWDANLRSNVTSALSFGGQFYDNFELILTGNGNDFAGPGDKVVDSGARTSASETRESLASGGLFLQEMIGFSDRLFITAGLRLDGHSSFGEDFGLAPYPKISAAYMVSDHDFWPTQWVDALKLRAAYGESGKAPGAFDAIRTWESVAADDAQPGVTPANVGNADLGPERTREFEVGFEGSALEGRVGFDFTYYDQTTYDALIDVLQVPSAGFGGAQLENVGKIANWGTEAILDLALLRMPSLDWGVGLRYSTNSSEVLDLGELETISVGAGGRVVVGKPLPAIYERVLQNPDGGLGVLPIYEEEYVGPMYPTRTIGLSTSATVFDQLTFDFVGEYQGGNYTEAWVAYQGVAREVWPPCSPIVQEFNANGVQNLTTEQLADCVPRYSNISRYTDRSDFFKLRSASVSYRVPARFLPGTLETATLRLSGRNLWTVSNSSMVDPEGIEDGSTRNQLARREYYQIPMPRTFLVSVNVNF